MAPDNRTSPPGDPTAGPATPAERTRTLTRTPTMPPMVAHRYDKNPSPTRRRSPHRPRHAPEPATPRPLGSKQANPHRQIDIAASPNPRPPQSCQRPPDTHPSTQTRPHPTPTTSRQHPAYPTPTAMRQHPADLTAHNVAAAPGPPHTHSNAATPSPPPPTTSRQRPAPPHTHSDVATLRHMNASLPTPTALYQRLAGCKQKPHILQRPEITESGCRPLAIETWNTMASTIPNNSEPYPRILDTGRCGWGRPTRWRCTGLRPGTTIT